MRTTLVLVGLSVAVGLGTARAEVGIPPEPARARDDGRRINVPAPDGATGKSATGTDAEQNPHMLRFFNGDVLHGRLLAATMNTGLRWGRTDARGVIEFTPGDVATVKLTELPTVGRPHQQTRVMLTNDDVVRGTIVSLDSESLVLDTWYAGSMTIRRAMVRSLQPSVAVATSVYEGPTAPDEWRVGEGERGWAFRNGALYANSSGAVGRDVKLPDRARIEFDVAWRNQPYFQVAVYTDNLEALYGNCYVVQISGNSVYLQRSVRNNFQHMGGGVNIENWRRRVKAHITLLVDKPKKTFALLVDDELVKQWTDPNEFAGRGTGMVFYSQGQGVMRFNNIVVTEWSGEWGNSEPAPVPAEDAIRFINNDKVSGQLKTIAKTQVTFVTPFATLDVPLERVAEIQFAGDHAERARRQAGDLRAVFQDGGSVTVALEKLDEQTMTGNSENFGQRTFARDAFRELVFNVYDERASATQTEDEWDE